MLTDLQLLYEKYVDYVTRLREDFIQHLGLRLCDSYGPRLRNFDDFCLTWQHWGKTEGLQEEWRGRFEAGYDSVAKKLTERLREVFSPAESRVSPSSLGKAA